MLGRLMCRLWRNRACRAAVVLTFVVCSAARAQTQGTIQSSVTISPPPPAAVANAADGDQLLQLETFVNDRPTRLVAAFMLHADGALTSSRAELDQIGLKVPDALAEGMLEIPLARLPGVAYRYDEAMQTIHFTVSDAAQQPTRISGLGLDPSPTEPARPPLGAVVNYTLFGSAEGGAGGAHFDGLSGEFETRAFGQLGLVEHSFIGRVGGRSDLIRLDSTYTYESPERLVTFAAGDFISGGFSWTRPVRMAGIQIRRAFGLRPDLVTLPLPNLTGSAAAPSTLDLYINKVQMLSTTVPQGPYEIDHPPMIYGGGQAQVVLRDALGRETVSNTPFYTSPDLLDPGLTDFSAEIGFARRNYAVLSNDYDSALVYSASYRRGLTSAATLEAHAEGAGAALASIGAGAAFTVGKFGIVSMAASESTAQGRAGTLVEAAFESRMPHLTLLFRTQRTYGDYEDLASWTAPGRREMLDGRNVFSQPREIDQAAVSAPLPWTGSSLSANFIEIRRTDEEHSRIVEVSFTRDFGRLVFFANASTDIEVPGSAAVFFGFSLPLGRGVTASTGATYDKGGAAGYAEASRQSGQGPGAFGWSVKASEGEKQEAQGIVQYATRFAHFEGTALYTEGDYSATGLMEGAVTLIGRGLHATQRLDNAFALVEVGAPGVTILRENRRVGVTDKTGQLLVPDLAPFVSNRIALDPAGLPVDARVNATEVRAVPFNRVASLVDLRVETEIRAALVTLVDPQGRFIELGSQVEVIGEDQTFVVGYDGEAYVDNLRHENELLVTTPDEATCLTRFGYRPAPGEQVRVGPLVCRPTP
jgi:outer membrane usher protein